MLGSIAVVVGRKKAKLFKRRQKHSGISSDPKEHPKDTMLSADFALAESYDAGFRCIGGK